MEQLRDEIPAAQEKRILLTILKLWADKTESVNMAGDRLWYGLREIKIMTSCDQELEEAVERALRERCGEELLLNEMKPAAKSGERSRRSTERRKMYRATMQQRKVAAVGSESDRENV